MRISTRLSYNLHVRVLCFGWLASTLRGSETSGHQRKNYNNYKVLRLYPDKEQQLEVLNNLAEACVPEIDFWIRPRGINRSVDVMVSPNRYVMMHEILTNKSIQGVILIDNVTRAIEAEQGSDRNNKLSGRSRPTFFYSYHRLKEIHEYMKYLASEYPKLASTFPIGKSFEGRDLLVLKINTNKSSKKPVIWIDGGTHAREWITPSSALYIANRLLNDYEIDANVTKLLDGYEWYILPVMNPDGYEYSHTTDRLWRKTRSRTISLLGCRGVDLNRNWSFKWNHGGSSISPCSDIYAGLIPFSEPEIKAIANFIVARKKRVKLFLTLHSYSQMWLTPWGWAYKQPRGYTDQLEMANIAVQSLKSLYGTSFETGSISKLLYIASGGSVDWAFGRAGIKYSYTLELRDTGKYGFFLPANQIIPSGEELWTAVKALTSAIYKKL